MINVLFVELSDTTICVVPASQVTSLGLDSGDTNGARVAVLEELLDAPAEAGTRVPRTVVVVHEGRKTVFRTSARLRLGEVAEDCFVNLPRVMRDSRCQRWVRGMVTLPPENTLGVWLDIQELADELWSENDATGEEPQGES